MDGFVRFWDVATGKEHPRFVGHAECVTGLAFAPGGESLYSASLDGTVRVWDAAKGDERAVLRGHESVVNALAVSPDGKVLATASADGTVRLWDTAARKELRVPAKDHGNALAVAFSPTGAALATASTQDAFPYEPPHRARDGTVRLWDWKSGKELRRFEGSPGASHLAFAPVVLPTGVLVVPARGRCGRRPGRPVSRRVYRTGRSVWKPRR